MWNCQSSFTLLLCMLSMATCCTVQLEAESGVTTGTRIHHTAASDDISVLLHKDDYVKYLYFTSSENVISVQNVGYFNDGIADQIRVSLNGTRIIGSFTSSGTGNAFLNSGPIGNKTSISPGEHEIVLEAISADEYGVELDTVTLTFTAVDECPKFEVTSSDDGSDSDGSDSDDSGSDVLLTTGEIIAIAGVLVGVPSCCISICGIIACIIKAGN